MVRYMKWMEEHKKHENLTYLVLWGMLFAVPVLSLYVRSVSNPVFDFEWKEIFMIWKQFGIFLAIFLAFFFSVFIVSASKRWNSNFYLEFNIKMNTYTTW